MTVEDLIEILKERDCNKEVVLWDTESGLCYNINAVIQAGGQVNLTFEVSVPI